MVKRVTLTRAFAQNADCRRIGRRWAAEILWFTFPFRHRRSASEADCKQVCPMEQRWVQLWPRCFRIVSTNSCSMESSTLPNTGTACELALTNEFPSDNLIIGLDRLHPLLIPTPPSLHSSPAVSSRLSSVPWQGPMTPRTVFPVVSQSSWTP